VQITYRNKTDNVIATLSSRLRA